MPTPHTFLIDRLLTQPLIDTFLTPLLICTTLSQPVCDDGIMAPGAGAL